MKTLILFCAALAAASAKQASYVIMFPSKTSANSEMTISVNIVNASRPVTLTAAAQKFDNTLYPGATATGVFTAGTPGELKLKAPSGNGNIVINGTGGLTFTQSKSFQVQSGASQLKTFIQTDKGTYKPSDTVRFRVLTVDGSLLPVNDAFDVHLYDGAGNRIKQWVKVTPKQGVITQKVKLSSQPVMGTWNIKVITDHSTTTKTFVVEEYVLPKFEVTVEMPSYSVIGSGDIVAKVRAKYTYGKPVKGQVNFWAKVNYDYITYDKGTEQPFFNTKIPITGAEVSVRIPMTQITQTMKYLNSRTIHVLANVTEDLTGKTMTGTGKVKLYTKDFKLSFAKNNPKNFKPGLDTTVYALLQTPDDRPYGTGKDQVRVDVQLTLKDSNFKTTRYPWQTDPGIRSQVPTQNISVGLDGLVEIPLNIPDDTMRLNVQVSYGGDSRYLNMESSHSPSDSFLKLKKITEGTIQRGDSVDFKLTSTEPVDYFLVQVISRGKIVHTQTVQGNKQTAVKFSLQAEGSMTPTAKVVAYFVRGDGEIVTDGIDFDVSGIFDNKVSVSVSKGQAQPGEKIKVTVTSDPNSQAHLLGIDQSVLLLRGGNDITADDVAATMKSPSDRLPFIDQGFAPFPGGYGFGSGDASSTFREAGVQVLTDGLVYQYRDYKCRFPFRCPWLRMRARPIALGFQGPAPRMQGGLMARAGLFGGSPLKGAGGYVKEDKAPQGIQQEDLVEVKKPRSSFTESWIWSSLDVRANGSASVVSAVPDTITSWVVSAFAVNDQSGLGIASSQAKLKVFRPFFVSLNLPYSVTRGEQLVLQAIVFNYMATDMQVRVTLAKSDSFFNIEVDSSGAESYVQKEAIQDVSVKAGDAKSVFFPIVAADLGKIDIEVKAQSSSAGDAVRRQLLVEAEGVPKEISVPVVVDLTGSATTFSKKVDINLPSNVVQGSEFTRITAAGDLMVPSVEGLDSLLRMPSGCGEQNMLGMAPDVYVSDYLKTVNRLSGELRDKVIRYMDTGYQRELTYKHNDHSFSAFGDRDKSGSTWLTAFVCRVFHQAKSHIDIDDTVITKAINWVISKQASDGSFTEPGRVIHKNMQGQAGNGTGLSLFVLISLLENADLFTQGFPQPRYIDARSKALNYLEAKIDASDDIYELALAAYAFQMAGSKKTDAVLAKLEQKASSNEGQMYWQLPTTTKSSSTRPGSWKPPNRVSAADVEVTAYVLLTYAARKDLVKGGKVMKWISQQRNSNGGFISTQDTVVALNAMSEFAKLTYSDKNQLQITTQINSTLSYNFDIDSTNALLLQSREMKSIPASVTINAQGNGMALVQVASSFNVESEIEDVTFNLRVTLIEDLLNRLVLRSCAKWLGQGSASGMAVQEIGVPSGFDVDRDSLPSHALLKRSEFQNKKLVLYFDEINTTELCLDVVVERTGLVAKSQPSPVRVYDYYEPTNQMTVFYQSQTLKGSNICDVCTDCENCIKRRR